MEPLSAARLAVAALAAVGLVALGRATADQGEDAGDTAAALRQGRVEGVEEGRALAASEAAPAERRGAVARAFRAGYAAGANDVFGGYDGGWYLGRPYVVTLQSGHGRIAYRIASRKLRR